jgi:WD40 repeat protein
MRRVILVTVFLACGASALTQENLRNSPSRFGLPLSELIVDLKMEGTRIACLSSTGRVDVLDESTGKLIAKFDNDGFPPYRLGLSRDGDWVSVGRARELVPTRGDAEIPGKMLSPATLGGPVDLSVFREFTEWSLYYDTPRPTPGTTKGPPLGPCGGIVTIRRVTDENSAIKRCDFPEDIVSLAVDDARSMVVTRNKWHVFDKGFNLNAFVNFVAPLVICDGPHPNVLFSRDGKKFVALTYDQSFKMQVYYYNNALETPILLRRPPGSTVPWSIAMSPDDSKVAACGPHGGLILWDLDGTPDGRLIHGDRTSKAITHFIAFVGGSDRLFTLDDDGQGLLFDSSAGRVVSLFKGPGRDVRAASSSENMVTLVSGGFRLKGDTVEPLVVQRIKIK